MCHYHHNIYYIKSVLKCFSEACQKFITFHFSAIYWMSVFNFLVICSHSLLLNCFLFKDDVSFKVWRNDFGNTGGGIFGNFCRWGKKLALKIFLFTGLFFLFWRTGHSSLLAKTKLLYFLLHLGDVYKVSWQEATEAAAYLLCSVQLLFCGVALLTAGHNHHNLSSMSKGWLMSEFPKLPRITAAIYCFCILERAKISNFGYWNHILPGPPLYTCKSIPLWNKR